MLEEEAVSVGVCGVGVVLSTRRGAEGHELEASNGGQARQRGQYESYYCEQSRTGVASAHRGTGRDEGRKLGAKSVWLWHYSQVH